MEEVGVRRALGERGVEQALRLRLLAAPTRKLVTDLLCDLVRRLGRVERDAPLGEHAASFAVAVGHGWRGRRRPRSRSGRARRWPRGRRRRLEREHERAVGQQAAGDDHVQLEHALDAEPARDPLVDERRVEVAVADDPAPRASAGRITSLDELGARGREEGRLGPGAHLEPVQDELADRLAERRPAGLARRDHLAAFLAQPLGEQGRLGRLPRAVRSLEGDEHRCALRYGVCGQR